MKGMLGTLLMWVIAILLIAGLVNSGMPEHLLTIITSALGRIGGYLRLLLIAVALPCVLVGALIAVSPKHRGLGMDVAIGGVIALVVAALGDKMLHWFSSLLTNQAGNVFQ